MSVLSLDLFFKFLIFLLFEQKRRKSASFLDLKKQKILHGQYPLILFEGQHWYKGA